VVELAKPLIESVEDGRIKGFINPIVASEVLFFYVKVKTGLKSYELKKKPSVLADIELEPVFELFSLFSMLDINSEIVNKLEEGNGKLLSASQRCPNSLDLRVLWNTENSNV